MSNCDELQAMQPVWKIGDHGELVGGLKKFTYKGRRVSEDSTNNKNKRNRYCNNPTVL